MDFPLYDDKEHRYRDDDPSCEVGCERVAVLLGLPEPLESDGLRFRLSFYSGGSGVFDRHAVAMDATDRVWAVVAAHLNAQTPSDCASDGTWGEDFRWLVDPDARIASIDDAAMAFVNEERADFQAVCTGSMSLLFGTWSNVNDWTVLWGTRDRLNYLAFSQG